MKTLYIWGTGNDATRLTREYPILAIYARNFVDSAKEAKDMFFKGKRVVSPDCIIWDNCFVIIQENILLRFLVTLIERD